MEISVACTEEQAGPSHCVMQNLRQKLRVEISACSSDCRSTA